ncbi:glycosyltransferase [Suttonella ornithocola]|uniref:UDP-galactofuranosyl transferase GlfT1 n=1 Tax=Suttonella ornithocola TaxID=279832 RepID=A0A380MSD2_9GAMM|nr:glycosyltransferase [Suttonella ornithocola]SUO95539.1 UDP-galactofuranosyl transferase GlfT1 [Suttonella ornithocola]
MNDDSIGAVIVTFNRLEKLKKTLEASLSQAFSYIVIIDNASTDGTQQWLKAQTDSRLRFLFLEKNIGGAGGFHEGVKLAQSLEVDWLVLYDDDSFPAANSIQTFLGLDKKNIDALAAAVYYLNGQICEMNRPSWNPFWHKHFFWKTVKGLLIKNTRAGFHLSSEAYQGEEYIDIDASSFVGFFVRREVIKTIGLPQKELFIYADDMLYTLRLSKFGRRLVFFPMVKFIHDCSTFRERSKAYHPMWKAYFTYRNGLFLYKFAAGKWFYGVAILKILTWLLAIRHYKNKWKFLQLWWLAVYDGMKGNSARSSDFIMRRFS